MSPPYPPSYFDSPDWQVRIWDENRLLIEHCAV